MGAFSGILRTQPLGATGTRGTFGTRGRSRPGRSRRGRPRSSARPRVISLQRINGAAFTAILALGSSIGVLFSLLREDDAFGARWVVIPALWLASVVLFAQSFVSLARGRMSSVPTVWTTRGIEIRAGVHWRW